MESGLSLGKKKPNVQPILSPSKEIQELFDVKFICVIYDQHIRT